MFPAIPPKLLMGAAVVAVVFFTGWTVNGWRHAARYAKAEREIQEQLADRRAELRAQFEVERQRDEAARIEMLDQLNSVRARNEDLREQVARLELVKPPEQIVVERVIQAEGGETCEAIANPFSTEFVRLFNESAHLGDGAVSGADSSG